MPSPIKISWKTEAVALIMLAACALASVYFYNNFPALVATHWDFRGQADGFSGKAFAAFFFPLLILAMYGLFLILPQFDPKKDRYAEFQKPYGVFRHMIVGVMALIYLATGVYNLGYEINIGIFVATVVGIMMIVIGSYMDKLKSNWFVGIKTPWTLSSEAVWDKTHRLGKFLFIVFGVILIIMPYLPELLAIIIFIIWLTIMIFGVIAYSWWQYRKEMK